MPTRNNLGLFILVSALTTLLTSAVIVAPLPARYLRLSFGRTAFWLFTLASSCALFFYSPDWALKQFTVLLLIGLFTDLEQNKVPVFYAGIISVFFAAVSWFFLLGTWARSQHMGLAQFLKTNIDFILAEQQKLQLATTTITSDDLISVLPGVVTVVLMFLVCFGLLFVKAQGRNEKISAFKVPDMMIWLFIVSLAGAKLLTKPEAFYIHRTAENLLFFCGAIYYFQGLAIVGFFLQRARVNYFLKSIFFILMAYLFFIPLALGLSDVWFSYRSKWFNKLLKDNPRSDV